MFNKRAKEWRHGDSDLNGNMRDYASLNELLVLANMESYNAILIEKGYSEGERLLELRRLVVTQMLSLSTLTDGGVEKLKADEPCYQFVSDPGCQMLPTHAKLLMAGLNYHKISSFQTVSTE